MTPDEIQARALIAEQRQIAVNLVFAGPKPKGFPRGELMCVNSAGHKVYHFDPIKLMEWYRRVLQAREDKA